MSEPAKTCRMCERTMPLIDELWYREARNADGFRLDCKECCKRVDAERRIRHKPATRFCRSCKTQRPSGQFSSSATSCDVCRSERNELIREREYRKAMRIKPKRHGGRWSKPYFPTLRRIAIATARFPLRFNGNTTKQIDTDQCSACGRIYGTCDCLGPDMLPAPAVRPLVMCHTERSRMCDEGRWRVREGRRKVSR